MCYAVISISNQTNIVKLIWLDIPASLDASIPKGIKIRKTLSYKPAPHQNRIWHQQLKDTEPKLDNPPLEGEATITQAEQELMNSIKEKKRNLYLKSLTLKKEAELTKLMSDNKSYPSLYYTAYEVAL